MPRDGAELELKIQLSLSLPWHPCSILSLSKVVWAATTFQLLGSAGLPWVPSLGPGPERG